MLKVTLLGGGNLATNLANKLLDCPQVTLMQIYNRSIQNIASFAEKTRVLDQLDLLEETDIYIIAVSDAVIEEISEKLSRKKGLVVHTSGAMHLNVLKNNKRRGVFYPLQSFTKNVPVDFSNVPFCIEALNESDFILLEKLASEISKKVYRISSLQREKMHVAAVFVNNFVNHLYRIGAEICSENEIPFEILHPLILETATKINTISPELAQTGPAKRNDFKTIEKHQKELKEENLKIYKLLTKSILNRNT